MSTLRLLKYHACEGKDLGENYFRAGAHADFDVLTLLFQRLGQDGLEVCPGRKISTEYGHGDKWTPIKVERGAIVCNIGDQLMRWSDGESHRRRASEGRRLTVRADQYKSTFHRVRCPRPGEYQGDRYSIGFFNQARKGALIQGPNKAYPEITGGEFLAEAMKRNYQAALDKAKLETYDVRQSTLEANRNFAVSGTGLARPSPVAQTAA